MSNYQVWEPIENIIDELYFYSLEYEKDCLIILLKELTETNRVLRIKFAGVLGYRVFQETSRMKTLRENRNLRGFKSSENSDFIKWFKEESYGIFDDWELRHYIITNIDNVIDIISGSSIEAEWVET